MRWCLSTCLSVALSCAPDAAEAQPCCSGGTALTPAKLTIAEDGLVGLETASTVLTGSFDKGRDPRLSPDGTAELGSEQRLLAAARVLPRAQLWSSVPIVETWRKVPGRAEAGGGLGDTVFGVRWDFAEPAEWEHVPGIAVLGAVTVPTGTPPERASRPLATDATGAGAARLAAGVQIDPTVDDWTFDLTATASWSPPRRVHGLEVQPGVELAVAAGVAYALDMDTALGLALSYRGAFAARESGEEVPDSGRALTRLSFVGGWALAEGWRAHGAAYGDLPIPGLGQNELLHFGLSFLLLRAWS